MKNVLEWLENICTNYPSKTAFIDMNKTETFEEIMDASRRIGSFFKPLKHNAPIAVLGSRRIETIEAFLGVAYSGHIYSPIDAGLPDKRVKDILSILKPSAILTDDMYLERFRNFSDDIPIYTIEAAKGCCIDKDYLTDIRNEMVSTDPLYIIFTSGSTGKPKGVITSHQSLMCYIKSYSEVMRICKEDILGNQAPLDYIAAIRDIYLPLLTGALSVIIPKELFMEPNRLFEFINDNKINTVGWSVSALTIPLKLGAFEDVKPLTLKKICFSGAVMPAESLYVWQDNLPNALFVNQYGPTETTASCTYYVIDHRVGREEKLPIGKAYDNYKVFLLSEDLSPTAPGEIGEICVSGPGVALGYYNDPEMTRKSFIDNPNTIGYSERMYRTGDYGRLRDDGILEFHGRKDRQIKHLGHRVELDEIEFAANAIDGINECLALYDDKAEIITIFYSGTIEKKELVSGLKNSIPAFMVPRKVIKLEHLPRLENGKIDMLQLRI